MLTVYLRSLVHDETAIDDLFQETMVVAWRRLDECDLDRPFWAPWLRGIASRLVMAHYRTRKKQPAFLDEGILQAIDRQFESLNARVGDTWDEKVAALRDCLDRLPEKQRHILGARYLEDLPTQLVAERFQLSLEACKKRLQRGRTMIADCLKRKGVLTAGQGTS